MLVSERIPSLLLAAAILTVTACIGSSATAGVAMLDPDGTCTLVGMGTEYRSFDGSCNNLHAGRTKWGSSGSELLRLHDAAQYDADMETPLAAGQPGAREISNAVSAQTELVLSEFNASSMLMQWGQFLDHDLDLTHTDSSDAVPINAPWVMPISLAKSRSTVRCTASSPARARVCRADRLTPAPPISMHHKSMDLTSRPPILCGHSLVAS